MEMKQFGRYEIVAEIGKGAMGVVYRANDPLLDRTVAIKTVIMSDDPQEMAEYEARFYQEAKAAGSLNHPNIVTIYDIGKSGNIAYMAMELLEGQELRTELKPGVPLETGRAIDIAAQVAEGLAYAHQNGVVHRDVKPANIMIIRNTLAKVMDFGIARMRQSEVRTQTGVVLGSPRYMSPEQVAGKRAEPRSDIFSLGVILYEMLTGRPAFTGDDVTSVMFQILNVTPPPPSTVNSAVPAVFDFIMAKALAKPPEDRYQDAGELARDLRDGARQSDPNVLAPASRPMLKAESTGSMAASLPVERSSDMNLAVVDTAPTMGLSKAFDSMSATMRLAHKIGMAEAVQDIAAEPETGSATEARALVSELRKGPGWSERDMLVFAVCVGAALVVGVIIILA